MRATFSRKPGTPKVPLRENQFGFEVGGPVYIPKLYDGRNKTFFMANYEGLRLVKQVSALDTVLTPQMRQGDFSQVTKQLNAVNGTAFQGTSFRPVCYLHKRKMP